MKRQAAFYVLIACTLVVAAVMTALGFVWDLLILQILGICGIVVALLCLAVFGAKDSVETPCNKLFAERDYDAARMLLEKKMKSPFYFLMRIPVMKNYIRVCMALDDLGNAARYIDRLRHGGGKGWKYMTAYCFILIKLDEGDIRTARHEFEDFRKDCAHAEIYKTQIEILTAIFSRLFSARNIKPLPESAVESRFPVVSRILGRHYEAQSQKEEWN